MKYTEDTLQFWTSPLSNTEEQRVKNTVSMIKNAVSTHDELSNCTMEIFAQGSYANNTNVRQNSDVDICIMLTSTFFGDYVDGKSAADYGFTPDGMPENGKGIPARITAVHKQRYRLVCAYGETYGSKQKNITGMLKRFPQWGILF